MLAELHCDDFKTKNKPITFRYGLNTIFGTGNDVGKSTFLTVLDFVFGGSKYLRLTDIKSRFHLHVHTLNFAFRFGDKIHRFSRNFADPNNITVYEDGDDSYKKVKETIPVADFQELLRKLYGMEVFGATFYDIVGRYIRIMAKGNIESKNPLKASSDETKETSLGELLKLFGFYKSEEEFQRVQEMKEAESKAKDELHFYESASRLKVPEFESDFFDDTA